MDGENRRSSGIGRLAGGILGVVLFGVAVILKLNLASIPLLVGVLRVAALLVALLVGVVLRI
jgi:hypothetical protein